MDLYEYEYIDNYDARGAAADRQQREKNPRADGNAFGSHGWRSGDIMHLAHMFADIMFTINLFVKYFVNSTENYCKLNTFLVLSLSAQ